MARSNLQTTKETYKYPSHFGSHKSMVVEPGKEPGTVVCQDEFGTYVTEEKKLDNGLADPNRYTPSRLRF